MMMGHLFSFGCGCIAGIYVTQNYQVPLISKYIAEAAEAARE